MSLKFTMDGSPYIDLGNGVHIALDYSADEAAVKKAHEELREDPETVEAGLQELRKLLRDDADLTIPINDDTFLKKFLLPKKYYAQSAYEIIKGYYKYKAIESFILYDLTVERIRMPLEENLVQLLPQRDQHGRRVILMEMGAKWDYTKVSYPELVRSIKGLVSLLVLEPRTQLHGMVFICNFDKFSFGHLTQFTPKFAKQILDFGQKYMPMRVKGINIVNNSELFGVLFNMLKPFFGKKWKNRIHFHGSKMESLHKQVDADRLPSGFKGTLDVPEVEGKVLMEFVQQHCSKIDELQSFGYKTGTA